ncbi:hypothetical protein BOX15_Mlig013407g1 [Macrostomum lignano]|uniref:Uncharacterized protein n=1 Tax=Macrostomum lignano TaxID=282301 RepID=A0A267EUN4_9PLAT|nr:hypothetical protein BOX15_Mlig013407g1 [Macrostomum lignano]
MEHQVQADEVFRQVVNSRQSQTTSYLRRACRRETDPQALFGTMGDNEFRRAKREQLARMQAAACGDYAYPGAGFLNARPAQRSTFSVHPEWVSEKYARLNTQQDGRL